MPELSHSHRLHAHGIAWTMHTTTWRSSSDPTAPAMRMAPTICLSPSAMSLVMSMALGSVGVSFSRPRFRPTKLRWCCWLPPPSPPWSRL